MISGGKVNRGFTAALWRFSGIDRASELCLGNLRQSNWRPASKQNCAGKLRAVTGCAPFWRADLCGLTIKGLPQ